MPLANRRPPPRPVARPAQPSTPARSPARAHLLDIPFELRGLAQAHGADWDGSLKAYLYRGESLPEHLRAFASQPYSWERLKEDEVNGASPVAAAPTKEIVLRDHQKDAVEAISAAVRAGRSGFLVADDVGLGKTIETWASVLSMDADTVLIVCPLAVVAHWRRTIEWMGDGGKRVVVINYDRLKKLFDVPAGLVAKASRKRKGSSRRVRTAKGVARYGEAYEFDVVVFDESHKLRNLETARSKMALRLSAEAEFVLWLSATAGQNPLELAYLSPILAESTGCRVSQLKEFEKWCRDQGLGVSCGAFGKWAWRGNAKEEADRVGADEDLAKVRQMLFGGRVPVAIRRTPSDIEGWPEINRILLPVALEGDDARLYAEAWGEFRRQLGLERAGHSSPKSANGLVARLRFRQKASLLRTAATADLALELLEQGQQVAVSVAFKETLAVLKEALEKAGHVVAAVHGEMTGPQKEAQRLDFQHGRATVCVYTVEEGISLHEGEYNDAKRSNLVHDLRWSAIQMKQIEGRTHRDGKFSQVYWMLGAGTVEEEIAAVVAGRMRSMSMMQGDDATVEGIERLLGELAS